MDSEDVTIFSQDQDTEHAGPNKRKEERSPRSTRFVSFRDSWALLSFVVYVKSVVLGLVLKTAAQTTHYC
jgi:hypothetical protein